jgi:hypothetical protein
MELAPSPVPQSSAPGVTLATLRAVLAKGQAEHPDLAGRMDKAAHILATRDVTPTGDDGRSWWVASETAPDQWYLVITTPRGVWPCTCKDHERRRDWCKHALAIALLRRCQESTAAPIPFPERAYGDDDRFELTDAGAAYLATLDGDPA